MTEELLHFIWMYRFFDKPDLCTTDGLPVEVINQGTHNTDAGPDFFNAKIKIGDTLWAGNVEMHLKASDWNLHNHQHNPDYNNVILHVVCQADATAITFNHNEVPVLILNVPEQLLMKYKGLMDDQKWLVCQDGIRDVDPLELSGWLERCMISKLEERSAKIQALLSEFNGDWDQVFFVVLARSFGFGTNAQPFEMMARQTPFKVLMRHADSMVQLEALLLGQAGFLADNAKDDYHTQLVKEYRFLSEKYNLKPVEGHLFKFLRLRPVNFPTIRLCQLAAFVHKSQGLLGKLLLPDDPDGLMWLMQSKPSNYWNTHYLLGEQAADEVSKSMGVASRRLVTVNAIVPYMFAYAVHRGNEDMQNKALRWLEQLPPESNHITKGWQAHAGITPANAFDAQALVFLRNHYCIPKKCLQCKIGLLYLAKKEPNS